MIVHAFEQWGIDCLQRFRGMFALAIWDARSRELWLARDRIGIKPLYYSTTGGQLAFGSRDQGAPRGPGAAAAHRHEARLPLPVVPDDAGATDVLRGHPEARPARGSRGRERDDREAALVGRLGPRRAARSASPTSEIAERVLAELRTSVELRKVSDVPVGVFLSGGIDSSTNAALFSEGESRPVRHSRSATTATTPRIPASSLRASDGRADRRRASRAHRLAGRPASRSCPRWCGSRTSRSPTPSACPSTTSRSSPVETASSSCQVGEGADELFWGYPSWRTHLRLQRADDLPVPAYAKRAGLAALAAAGRERSRPYEFLRRGAEGVPVFWGGAEAFTETQKRRLLGPELRASVGGLTSWEALAPIRQRFDDGAWDASHLNWMTYLDLRLRLPELLLARIDKMSMGVGLEGRVPFLDHKFVELALSIPPRRRCAAAS